MRTGTGPAAFGRAYQTMLERDAHARRLALLFDLQRAYSGHVIVEAHRAGHWGRWTPAPGSSTPPLTGEPRPSGTSCTILT